MRSSISMVCFVLAACGGGEDHGGGDGAPVAPSNLTAELLQGGAHLTWQDNSDNEVEFMVMRKEMGGTDYTIVATTPFDTELYHDAPLTSGKTFVYMVMAHSNDGESESNEASLAIP
jgi:hypothetical protein